MKRLSIFPFLILTSVLVACERSADTVLAIPSVRVGCTSADSPGCQSGNTCGMTVLVQMTRSGCGESINYDPVATGTESMVCDASGCEATVSQWTDPSTNSRRSEILNGLMDICSTIDINCSVGDADSGDLVNEVSENIQSSSTILVDQWEEVP